MSLLTSHQMTVCVIASFTLCTYLEIDLARIPRPWFPVVVFCFGLGNMYVESLIVRGSLLTDYQISFD